MRKFITLIFLWAASFFSTGCFGQAGTWQILKTINDAAGRSECGLAEVDGKLYLLGGEGNVKLQVFDPVQLTWTEKAPAPLVMHHFEAIGYNHKVYVLEAFTTGNYPDQPNLSNVYIYDTQKDNWQKGNGLDEKRRRAAAGAVEYKGKLYLVNGIQNGHKSGTTNMFDCYDPATDSWTNLPNAPHIRDHCSATVLNDKLYIMGGRNTSYHEQDNFMAFFSKTVLEVDCYDFKTGQWTTLAAKLPVGSGGGAAVNMKGVLYYMGGERATDTKPNGPQKNTYFLNPVIGTEWTETDTLHFARNGMAAAVFNNTIYAAGGAGGSGGPPPPPVNVNGGLRPGKDMNGTQAQNSIEVLRTAPPKTFSSNPPPPSPPGNNANHPAGSICLEVFTVK